MRVLLKGALLAGTQPALSNQECDQAPILDFMPIPSYPLGMVLPRASECSDVRYRRWAECIENGAPGGMKNAAATGGISGRNLQRLTRQSQDSNKLLHPTVDPISSAARSQPLRSHLRTLVIPTCAAGSVWAQQCDGEMP